MLAVNYSEGSNFLNVDGDGMIVGVVTYDLVCSEEN